MIETLLPSAEHIYLSPHPDDVALSCGGTIFQQAHAGWSVAVVTIFAGSPPPGGPDSPLIRELHARWGAEADPPAVRRAEDTRALATLSPSIAVCHLDLLDCIYRLHPTTGKPLYTTEEALFGPVHPDDPARGALRDLPRPDGAGVMLYAPLAVGGHVDHRIVRLVVEEWGLPHSQVRYYEDYPYVEQPDALEHALRDDAPPGLAHRHDWQPQVTPLTSTALDAKVRAIVCYRSQISTFWGDIEEMGRAVRGRTARMGGERVWLDRRAGPPEAD
jgi:LmbE family N-acetylglucosaminyl deacetylase